MLSKLRHIILFACMFGGFMAQSQPYFNRFEKEATTFSAISVTDTGFIAVGRGFNDLFKTSCIYACNLKGDSLWFQYFGASSTASIGQKIMMTNLGFYIAGAIRDTTDGALWDFYLAYFNAQGDSIWMKSYGDNARVEYLEDAIITKNGDVVMVGVNRTESGDRDAWHVVKTDANGTMLWEKTIDGIENENGCRSLIETPEGDYVLVGEQEVAERQYDIWVVKLNSDGDRVWDTTYGGEFTDFSPEINLTPDGHLGIAFDYLQSSKSDSRAIKYLKMNRFTAEVMTDVSILDFNEGSVLTKPLYDAYGNVIIAGNFVFEFDLIGLVIKFNPASGDIIWSREYTRNSNLQHYIYDIQPTDDEGFVFCGSGYPEDLAGGFNQGWITRIDCKGADSLTHYFPEESCADYTSVNDYPAAEDSELLVYPNPASTNITLSLAQQAIKSVSISNAMGQVVYEQTMDEHQNTDTFRLNVNNWTAGMYVVAAVSATGKIHRKNFVVYKY